MRGGCQRSAASSDLASFPTQMPIQRQNCRPSCTIPHIVASIPQLRSVDLMCQRFSAFTACDSGAGQTLISVTGEYESDLQLAISQSLNGPRWFNPIAHPTRRRREWQRWVVSSLCAKLIRPEHPEVSSDHHDSKASPCRTSPLDTVDASKASRAQ
jgi:hypothetical protein